MRNGQDQATAPWKPLLLGAALFLVWDLVSLPGDIRAIMRLNRNPRRRGRIWGTEWLEPGERPGRTYEEYADEVRAEGERLADYYEDMAYYWYKETKRARDQEEFEEMIDTANDYVLKARETRELYGTPGYRQPTWR